MDRRRRRRGAIGGVFRILDRRACLDLDFPLRPLTLHFALATIVATRTLQVLPSRAESGSKAESKGGSLGRMQTEPGKSVLRDY